MSRCNQNTPQADTAVVELPRAFAYWNSFEFSCWTPSIRTDNTHYSVAHLPHINSDLATLSNNSGCIVSVHPLTQMW